MQNIFILFLFWLSINTGSKYVKIDNIFLYLTDNTFNFLRSILPYGILIYLLVLQKKIILKLTIFLYFLVYMAFSKF